MVIKKIKFKICYKIKAFPIRKTIKIVYYKLSWNLNYKKYNVCHMKILLKIHKSLRKNIHLIIK